jgi:hypothetical protein
VAENLTIAQGVQIGKETTSGTGVAASKYLTSIDIQPSPKASAKSFRPIGRKFATLAAVSGKDWTQAKIVSEQLTYGELPYLLCSAIKSVTPSSDTTLGKLWTLASSLSAEDTPNTFTVEVGSATRAGKFTYGLVTDLGFTFAREDVKVDGTMLGQQWQDAITMTSTPTAADTAPVPILGSQVSLYIGTSWANLDAASALTRGFAFSWNMSEHWSPIWAANAAAASFAGHAERAPKVEAKLTLMSDATGMGLLTKLRAGEALWIRAAAVGAEIESGKPYLFQLDGCYSVVNMGDFGDEEGVRVNQWTLEPVYDATAAKTLEFKVRNKLAAL